MYGYVFYIRICGCFIRRVGSSVAFSVSNHACTTVNKSRIILIYVAPTDFAYKQGKNVIPSGLAMSHDVHRCFGRVGSGLSKLGHQVGAGCISQFAVRCVPN